MKERPILFNGAMVRALLAGTKTQTRRMAKLTEAGHVKEPGSHRRWHPADKNAATACPYGQPGDRLWARETWQRAGGNTGWWYAATDSQADDGNSPVTKWRPSIYMPRTASRITLEIVSVRVERLQDIDIADATDEGVSDTGSVILDTYGNEQGGPIAEYSVLWEQVNGPGSWAANPWVWAVEFRKLP